MVKVFYTNKKQGFSRVYNTELKSFQDIKAYVSKGFFLMKPYKRTDVGLIEYAEALLKCCRELKQDKENPIDYLRYKNHSTAVIGYLKYKINHKVVDFDDTSYTEHLWISKCNTGALVGLYQDKDIAVDTYSYDFKSMYPATLGNRTASLQIPTKVGAECRINNLDYYKLDTGFYCVKITSDDENFRKVFNFSAAHTYTNIDLCFAYKCQRNGMQVNIELNTSLEFNCYLYGRLIADGIMYSSKVFGDWYCDLYALKLKYPTNFLLKSMLSSAWGYMTQCNRLKKTIDQIEDLESKGLYVTTSYTNDDNAHYYMNFLECNGDDVIYELINLKQVYKRPKIARIKPFLISHTRRMTGNIALLHIDDVVRIHTDCVSFNKPHDDVMTKYKGYPTLVKEAKSSGKIVWSSVNQYAKE